MSDKAQGITVELLGKSQQFACPPGQEQALIDAAAYLNDQVNAMKQRSTVRNDERALLMAALNLSHELLQLRREKDNALATQQKMCERLSETLGMSQDKPDDLP